MGGARLLALAALVASVGLLVRRRRRGHSLHFINSLAQCVKSGERTTKVCNDAASGLRGSVTDTRFDQPDFENDLADTRSDPKRGGILEVDNGSIHYALNLIGQSRNSACAAHGLVSITSGFATRDVARLPTRTSSDRPGVAIPEAA